MGRVWEICPIALQIKKAPFEDDRQEPSSVTAICGETGGWGECEPNASRPELNKRKLSYLLAAQRGTSLVFLCVSNSEGNGAS